MAGITAQELNVILSARDREFTKAMDRAQRRVERFSKKSKQDLNKTTLGFNAVAGAAKRLGPLLAGAFATAGAAQIANTAVEIGNLSSVAGVTTDRFQEMAYAASTFGVEQDKLADILKDVNDKFGDYVQTGAGPLADFFENIAPKVGLTADEFAKLSSEQKLGKYVKALEDANLSQADMTFYMEAIASDATLLQGAFANNGAELDRLSKKFRDAGAVMDEDMIKAAKEAKAEFDLASQVIRAQFSIALADLLPVITDVASFIAAMATNIGVAYEAMSEFINPTSQLEDALDNTTLAMGDEIRESQNLAMALGQSTNMSITAARQKLREAQDRYKNVQAIIAEQKALKLGSDEYQNILDTITDYNAALDSVSVNTADGRKATLMNKEAFEQLEEGLRQALVEQREFLQTEKATADQLARTEDNIKLLETALANAENGVVSFGQEIFTATGLSDRLSTKVQEGPIKSLADLMQRLQSTTDKAKVFNDVIFDPRDPNYDPVIAEFARLQMGIEATGNAGENAGNAIANGMNNATNAVKSLSPELQRAQDLASFVENSFERAFMSMIDGTTSAKDAFKLMARDIIAELYRIYFVKRVTSFIGDAIGLFAGPAPGSSASILGSAQGGTVSAGEPRVVGEHGREIFVPNQGGRILSVPQSKAAVSGGGGSEIVVNQTINVSTGVQQTVRTEIKSLMPQIADSAKNAVLDAKRRGGTYGRSF